MITDKFRHQLRHEAKLWQAEGIIDTSVYAQLSARYQFDTLEAAASNRFVMILLSLGGILLGLGVITFVAANWQVWSKELKTSLLLILLISVNVGGFYLWRSPVFPGQTVGKKQRFGHGLLIFGALILGANLALMSQMFHMSGSSYGLFIVWSLGVLAMAYSLQLVSLGVMSIILMGIGYWLAIGAGVFREEFSMFKLLVEHTALVAGVLFLPLAYWCRSRVIFGLTILLLIPSLQLSIGLLSLTQVPIGIWMALIFSLPAALMWGYDDSMWTNYGRQFQPVARNLALWFLAIIFFSLSFHGFWANSRYYNNSEEATEWWFLLDVVIFIAITAWQWWNLAKPSALRPNRIGFDSVTTVIAGLILVTGAVFFWHFQISSIPEIATFIFNVQMFLLAAGLIRLGLARGHRGAFWGGLILLTLQIISRVFEYDTELLLKSLVLVLCGVGVMGAGWWFERHFSQGSRTEENS